MNIFKNLKNTMGFGDDLYEDDDELMEEADSEETEEKIIKPSFFSRKNSDRDIKEKSSFNFERNTKSERIDVNDRSERNERRSFSDDFRSMDETSIKICVPTTFEDSTHMVDTLRDKKAIVLNTSNLDIKVAQRLLDFMAGATYTLSGDIKEVQEGIYVITPKNIRISDDFKAEEVKGLFNFNR